MRRDVVTRGHKTNDLACLVVVTEQAAETQRGSSQGDRRLRPVELVGFKTVNDSVGHSVRDRFLAEVGRRLGSVVRRHDTAARIGGDEFVIVAGQLGADHDVARVIDRVKVVLEHRS